MILKCTDALRGNIARSGDTNVRGIMLDTQGPEIRTGMFPDGQQEVPVAAGHRVVITVDDTHRRNQTPSRIWISYKDFPVSTHVGARL